MASNQHWQDKNDGRKYPLVDAASGALPGLLCDASIRWPRELGVVGFVASAVKTAGLVSVTFCAADDDADTGFNPLGYATVQLSKLKPWQAVPIVAQTAGVAGWVAFGNIENVAAFNWLATLPSDGQLAPKAGRGWRSAAVRNIAMSGAVDKLVGRVKLVGVEPLIAQVVERDIAGTPTDVIELRLSDATVKTAFADYAGHCGGRPLLGTCAGPVVATLNAVSPDCDGVITLNISGATIAGLSSSAGEYNGVVVTSARTLENSCPPPNLADEDGNLPNIPSSYCP